MDSQTLPNISEGPQEKEGEEQRCGCTWTPHHVLLQVVVVCASPVPLMPVPTATTQAVTGSRWTAGPTAMPGTRNTVKQEFSSLTFQLLSPAPTPWVPDHPSPWVLVATVSRGPLWPDFSAISALLPILGFPNTQIPLLQQDERGIQKFPPVYQPN